MPSLALACRLSAVSRASRRPFSPASLFSSGEQGVWYDPSDLSTLFQDAYGTTPVTAVGQPVGLILDKSKRVIFKITKADLLDNAKWTGSNSVSASTPTAVQLADGTVRITRNSTDTYVGFAPMANAYSLPPGCVVHFKYSVRSNTNLTQFSGEPYYKWRDVNPVWFDHIPSASVLTKNTVAINYTAAPITTNSFGWAPILFGFSMTGEGHAADEYIDVFDFEITAYAPAARQLTATSRPTLQQDTSGKYYLSFDGVDDCLSTGSIDFTGTDKMTVWAGVRKLRDSTAGVFLELSANQNTNAGSFLITIPTGANTRFAASLSEGNSSIYNAAEYTDSAAPLTTVNAVLFDKTLTSNEVIAIRKNGADQSLTRSPNTNTTGNFGNYPLYIGSREGHILAFNGHLYSLIVRGAQSSEAQILSAETYCNQKTGAY